MEWSDLGRPQLRALPVFLVPGAPALLLLLLFLSPTGVLCAGGG